MRKTLLVAATLFIAGLAGTGQGMARQRVQGVAAQDAWCARMPVNGGNPQCDFSTLRQCRATISGIGGDCIRNPAMAYNQMGSSAGWNDVGHQNGEHSAWRGWSNDWDNRRW